MEKLQILKTYETDSGCIIELCASPNPVSKSDFYKELAKIHYDHLQYIKQRKEA